MRLSSRLNSNEDKNDQGWMKKYDEKRELKRGNNLLFDWFNEHYVKKGDMFNINCINFDKLIRINKFCALIMKNRKKKSLKLFQKGSSGFSGEVVPNN